MKHIAVILALSLFAFQAFGDNKNNMEALIAQSNLYKTHLKTSVNVEIWDDNYTEEGWRYYSIVSNSNGLVRKLEYVRIKNGIMQQRKYDEKGDDLWLEAK